jgi:hypothetical protein
MMIIVKLTHFGHYIPYHTPVHQHHFGSSWQPQPPFKPIVIKNRYFRRKTVGWTREDKAAALLQVKAENNSNVMSILQGL